MSASRVTLFPHLVTLINLQYLDVIGSSNPDSLRFAVAIIRVLLRPPEFHGTAFLMRIQDQCIPCKHHYANQWQHFQNETIQNHPTPTSPSSSWCFFWMCLASFGHSVVKMCQTLRPPGILHFGAGDLGQRELKKAGVWEGSPLRSTMFHRYFTHI